MTKSYETLLTDLEGYNERTKAATENYENSLGTIVAATEEVKTQRDYAKDWATEAEDVLVDDGENPLDYSASHYAKKAAATSQEVAGLVQDAAANNILMTESQARAIHSLNENKYAASGSINSGKHNSNNINDGMFVDGTTPNNVFIGGGVNGSSKTDFAVSHIAGSVINAILENNQFNFELPEATDGTVTYNKSTGADIKHPDVATAFALADSDVNIEVVTHPVDLAMFEYYEEELTGRQEIFECIQSTSTTFGTTSVPTVLSTRKLSYFQQCDGQFDEVRINPDFINDRYRCVVWDDLTEPQKREIAAYMGEKLFVGENGHIVNGRLRARTIRGLGNGDWYNFKSTDLGAYDCLRPVSGNNNVVRAKGIKDSIVEIGHINGGKFSANGAIEDRGTLSTMKGVFTATNSNRDADLSVAYKGRCFAYVVATVPRASQGIYVEGLHEFGTAKCSDDKYWYESANKPVTLKDCFIGQVGGDIASGKSGHPDGIFYDGIEAGGLNCVIDWRLGAVANDSPEEAAKVEAKMENGTYRGLEKLVKSRATIQNRTSYTSAFQNIDISKSLNAKVGDSIWVTNGSDWFIREISDIRTAEDATNDVQVFWRDAVTGGSRTKGDGAILVQETNLSVSGEFNTQMVIGDPVEILKTDALKDGWLGTWCSVIPDGMSKRFPLTRKNIGGTSVARQYTIDSGATWVSGTESVNEVTNDFGSGYVAKAVALVNYKAFAKQTKPSTNKPVYNGKKGLMGIVALNRYTTFNGASFVYSLIGKVPTSSAVSRTYASLSLLEGTLTNHDKMGFITHGNIPLGAPTNNSPAVKVLPYQISNNGQASIGYQANELTWGDKVFIEVNDQSNLNAVQHAVIKFKDPSGTLYGHMLVRTAATDPNANMVDAYVTNGKVFFANNTLAPQWTVWDGSGWGDDDKIKITADGSATFDDRNGNTNLQVVHELALPYTWTSNRARSGPQVEGVDL
ncbi:hypothetical protein VPHK406_0065 [Vibrio phage K406]